MVTQYGTGNDTIDVTPSHRQSPSLKLQIRVESIKIENWISFSTILVSIGDQFSQRLTSQTITVRKDVPHQVPSIEQLGGGGFWIG